MTAVGGQAPTPRRRRKPAAQAPGILLEAWTTGITVNQLVVRELEREGIEPEGLAFLAVIRQHGSITPTALAAECGFRLTTISDILQRLEQARLVVRRPNPEDKRSHLASTTRAGDELLDRAAPAFSRALGAIEAELDRPLSEIDDAVAALKAAVNRVLRTPDS